MNRETSIYLDFVRFAAAMVVFLGHLSGHRFTGGLFWQFDRYLHEAVAVFFVLSGFVISYTADKPGITPEKFITDRLARIYSVAIPAMCITFLLDNLGVSLRPELYSQDWGYDGSNQIRQILLSLLFVNQLWTLQVHSGSMLSYWSLGYEVWYYVGFGVACFTTGAMRVALLVAVGIIVGPMILLMMPIWLLGSAAYHACKRLRLGQYTGAALWGLSTALWAMYEMKVRDYVPLLPLPIHLRYALDDYIVGLFFAVSVVGVQAMPKLVSKFIVPLGPLVRYLAGATFTIYLLHVPVAQFLTAVLSAPPSAFSTRVIVLSSTLLALFAIAQVSERQKDLWRSGIANLVKTAGGSGWRSRYRTPASGPADQAYTHEHGADRDGGLAQ